MVRIKFAEDFNDQPAVIRVIGLGGAGGNAVNRMIEAGVSHVEFIAANTDSQVLRRNLAPARVQLGERISKGLGVGGNPVLGRQAAEESRERLREVMAGADMIFVTAGMGGGTGTGAAAVVAEIARSLDPAPLVVAAVTRPFEFEGLIRKNQADNGIKELRAHVDTLLTIPNERLFDIIDEKTTSLEAFRAADNVLRQAVQSITDVITRPGMINVDFADVRTIMSGAGEALMGTGEGVGRDRALQAAKRALESPLLENVSIDGAKGLLVNISGNKNVTMFEIRTAMDYIRGEASQEAHVFYGQVFDDTLEDRLQVTVIATGFPPLRAAPAGRRGRARETERPLPAASVNVPFTSAADLLPGSDVRRPAYLRWKLRKLH
jgi:cell division protein FtsZ